MTSSPVNGAGSSPAGGAPQQRHRVLPAVVAAVLDIAFVVLFATRGRITHSGSATLTGLLEVAWPFLVGLAVAWVAARVPKRPFALLRSGAPVWVGTVVIGMILRVVTGSGTAFTFILVASGLLGVCFLGWRGIALLVLRLRRPRA